MDQNAQEEFNDPASIILSPLDLLTKLENRVAAWRLID